MTAPDILSADFNADPYPHYRTLRNHFPLLFHEATNSYLLSRYEDVEHALKNPAFSTRNYDWQVEPVYGRTILQMEGKEHSRHRNVLNTSFRGRDLFEKIVPMIHTNVQTLLDTFPPAPSQVDFVANFATLFPIGVIVDMLGLAKSELPRFHGWYTAFTDFLGNFAQDPIIAEAGTRAKAEFEAYIFDIITERRARPGEDLLSTLCYAEIDGVRMTDEEIKSFCSLLLTAGGETTDKALTLLLKNLIEHPDQMEAVRQDRSLVDKAFAETLRYTPPVHAIVRQPTEEVKVSGGTIPADASVMCLLGSANRDEQQYEAVDTFDIFREEIDEKKSFTGAAKHAAFSFGRHFCVGSLLAKIEVNVAINALLDHFSDIQFAEGVPPQDVGFFTRAPLAMKITYS